MFTRISARLSVGWHGEHGTAFPAHQRGAPVPFSVFKSGVAFPASAYDEPIIFATFCLVMFLGFTLANVIADGRGWE
ncbi:MAG: hypothetical protein HZT40_07510 [Candidatus Thiothrix singaporensis]|uniref:Uncharacterized protein n=1 Tax=Candidatus Thiothrix singaporensis TaxID=2799669 RepID=A0A7L6AQR3_9GAMM|nr:MAG: hypothetical protein HZT40_07510 [Candidatus Thiothrix singaporensis]